LDAPYLGDVKAVAKKLNLVGMIFEVLAVKKQGYPTVRFGEYLFGRPKSPGIFGFNCSEN